MAADLPLPLPDRRTTLRLVFPQDHCPSLETTGRTYAVVASKSLPDLQHAAHYVRRSVE